MSNPGAAIAAQLSLLVTSLLWLGCGASGGPTTSTGNPDADVEASWDAALQDSSCAQLEARFELGLEAEAQLEGRAGGAVAAVLTPSCGLWTGDTGDAEPGAQLSRGRLLRAGSVTKSFTAAAVLSLVANGELRLDTRLDAFLPDYPEAARITIEQLLNHTSGSFDFISDAEFMSAAHAAPHRSYAADELIAVAAAGAPEFEPGTSWSYSNTGYILLGRILERVTGHAVAEVLREGVLVRAGLERTFLEGSEAVPEVIAPGYGRADQDVTLALHPSVRWTAGAMVAEVGDLARWAHALYRGDLLPSALQSAMLSGVITTGTSSYGLGVYIVDLPGVGLVYGHGGDVPGYHTVMQYVPELDVAVVAIVNSDRAMPQPITRALLRVVQADAD